MTRTLFSAQAHTALAAAGLEPVGQVTGSVAFHLSWPNAGCGGHHSSGKRHRVTPVIVAGHNRAIGYHRYVKARRDAYWQVLAKLRLQATALRADGMVGATLTWRPVDSGVDELLALATAVRHRRGDHRPRWAREPFQTELSAQDVARAMLSGWAPLAISVGLALAMKHEDRTMMLQTSLSRRAVNAEVTGLTQVISAARKEARRQLTTQAENTVTAIPAAARGDRPAQVVVSDSRLTTGESKCREGPDHIAEALFTGTVLLPVATAKDAARSTSAGLRVIPVMSVGRSSSAAASPAVGSRTGRGDEPVDGAKTHG